MKSLKRRPEEVKAMKIDFDRTVQLLFENDNFVVLTHANPDGDTLGGSFALLAALKSLGKNARVECGEELPEKYRFLEFDGDDETGENSFVVSVDVADTALLPKIVREKYGSGVDLSIDHHGTNRLFAKETYLEGDSASVCEVVFLLIKALGVSIDEPIATRLYTGCSTDTGCFRYSNVTPRTHRIAAELIECGARHAEVNVRMFETKKPGYLKLQSLCLSGMELYFGGKVSVFRITRRMLSECSCGDEDCDALVALSRQIEGVLVGVTFKEKGDGSLKVSLRTHEGVDASKVCSAFGGGGHIRAAGCQFECGFEEAKDQVLCELKKYV